MNGPSTPSWIHPLLGTQTHPILTRIRTSEVHGILVTSLRQHWPTRIEANDFFGTQPRCPNSSLALRRGSLRRGSGRRSRSPSRGPSRGASRSGAGTLADGGFGMVFGNGGLSPAGQLKPEQGLPQDCVHMWPQGNSRPHRQAFWCYKWRVWGAETMKHPKENLTSKPGGMQFISPFLGSRKLSWRN